MPGYWNAHSDRDWEDECHMHKEPVTGYCPDDLECCPDHPDALVRRVYDADFYVLNGERAPSPCRTRTVRYECAECGLVLVVYGDAGKFMRGGEPG